MIKKAVIAAVTIAFCLSWMTTSFAQTSNNLPILYVGGRWTVWRFDPNASTSEVVYTLQNKPPLAVDTLSIAEQEVLQSLNLPDRISLLAAQIMGIWAIRGDRLLIQVDHFVCDPLVADRDVCAGYSDLLLLKDGESQQIAQADYHYQPASQGSTCGWSDSQLNDVVVNPVFDQVVVRHTNKNFHCSQTNSWGFVLDFSGPTLKLAEMPFSDNFAWSPDGQKLAYSDLGNCVGIGMYEECQSNLKIWENGSISELAEIPDAFLDADSYVPPHYFNQYGVAWRDPTTLTYEQRIATQTGMVSELVWHDFTANTDSYIPLEDMPRISVSNRLLGDNFVGTIRNSYSEEPILAIFSGDPSLTVLKTLEGYRVLGIADGPYLLMEEDSNYVTTFGETGIFILMPDFQIVKILLPPEIPDDPNDWVYLVVPA